MATKAKGLGQRAQLHPLDKTLYVMMIVLSAFMDVALCVLIDKLARSIVLRDSSAIYYNSSQLAWIPNNGYMQ